MLYPTALANDGLGSVYVLDVGNERAVWLGGAVGTGPSSVSVPHASSGLCVMDSAIVTFGEAGDSLVRVIDQRGRLRFMMGTPYSRNSTEESSLANGFLLCDARANEVVVLPLALPEIRAYGLRSGELMWKATLPGYIQEQIVQGGGQVTFTAPAGGFSQARGIHLLHPGTVVVQTTIRHPPTGGAGGAEQLTTSYFNLSDGQYLGQETSLSRLLAASDSVAFFAGRTDSIAVRGFRYKVAETSR